VYHLPRNALVQNFGEDLSPAMHFH
jgi:hypothetical protein